LKIGITPSVKETYKNQFEYCVDIELINFIEYCFKNSRIQIINSRSFNCKNIDFLVISGGNDLYHIKKNKKNFIRRNLEKKTILSAIKNKIPILGVCYGAQYLSNLFGGKILKTKGYVRKIHKVVFNQKKFGIKSVNIKCYHNYSIKKNNKLEAIATFKDKALAFFKIKNKKIYGIMWHPERDKKFNKFNKLIIKKICK